MSLRLTKQRKGHFEVILSNNGLQNEFKPTNALTMELAIALCKARRELAAERNKSIWERVRGMFKK